MWRKIKGWLDSFYPDLRETPEPTISATPPPRDDYFEKQTQYEKQVCEMADRIRAAVLAEAKRLGVWDFSRVMLSVSPGPEDDPGIFYLAYDRVVQELRTIDPFKLPNPPSRWGDRY